MTPNLSITVRWTGYAVCMTGNRSVLLPVLRGETQARVLAAILLHPGREISLADLSREVGSHSGNVHGEVQRLVQAGILADRRVGRVRLLRDAHGPYSQPLTDLLMIAYGPKELLEARLAQVPGVEAAYLFGSWAARYSGEPGAPPNDVDLLVIGSPNRDDVFDIANQVGREVRREVQVVFRSVQSWKQSDDAFVSTVRDRPLVLLRLRHDEAVT